jgi:putative tricarboxylic transport membrane protein
VDLIANIVLGFGVALTPENLLYGFLGCLLGTAIGVLPGIGPIATISLLLPITFVMPPLGGLIMLAGIYYGSQYGGSTTAILVNMPGESSAVITCIDGYEMARHGRAGAALTVAAVGSFFAGTVATLIIAGAAAPLGELAVMFGPSEYASLMVLGLLASVVLAHGPFMKALGMIFLGLLFGTIGTDVNSGAARYTFGFFELAEGLNFVPLAVGVFGITEILSNLEQRRHTKVSTQKLSRLWLSREDVRRAVPAVARGTAIGSLLGTIPGGGILLSTFAAYSMEKKISKAPEAFGKGAIEGVAAPESANNAASQISFIPMLTLGIPPTASLAMMMWAMTVHGIQPGPQVMSANPELFWGLVASMWVGNLLLVILNLPLIGLWVKLLHVPYRLLFPRDPPFLRDRGIQREQRTVRHLSRRAARFLRISPAQIRLRARAVPARLHHRTAAGREPSPCNADLSREPGDLHRAAAQRRVAEPFGRTFAAARGPVLSPQARGSFPRRLNTFGWVGGAFPRALAACLTEVPDIEGFNQTLLCGAAVRRRQAG